MPGKKKNKKKTCSVERSESRVRERQQIFVLNSNVVQSPVINTWVERASFFLTKKKKKKQHPAEKKGANKTRTRDSPMYLSMASPSGHDRLKRRLEGRGVPGSRSIAQL